jgi:cobalt/nickel transport system permease protein
MSCQETNLTWFFLPRFRVLTVQALFFADGGLLALGCNIFNLGLFPCFIAYPLIYRKIIGKNPTQGRILTGAVIAGIFSLQLGAFCVVLQTLFSGISELPFGTFLILMQSIHLAIGIAEGLVTAAVVVFVWKARPEVLSAAGRSAPIGEINISKVLIGLLAATVVIGGALSWFASSRPDGLEWAMFKTAGTEALETPEHGAHTLLVGIQEKTAFLPDYGFKTGETKLEAGVHPSWPAVDAGTSVSGLVGGALTLLVAFLIGLALNRRRKARV